MVGKFKPANKFKGGNSARVVSNNPSEDSKYFILATNRVFIAHFYYVYLFYLFSPFLLYLFYLFFIYAPYLPCSSFLYAPYFPLHKYFLIIKFKVFILDSEYILKVDSCY